VNLPYKAQLPVAKLGEFARRKLTYVILPEVYRTVRRPVQTAEQVQQRAFTSARLADQRQLLAGRNLQIQSAENHQIGVAGAVPLLQPNGPNHRNQRVGRGVGQVIIAIFHLKF